MKGKNIGQYRFLFYVMYTLKNCHGMICYVLVLLMLYMLHVLYYMYLNGYFKHQNTCTSFFIRVSKFVSNFNFNEI